MREVLAARSNRDFVRAAPRAAAPSAVASGARRLLGAALQRPGTLIGGLVIGTAATAIVVNALSYQSARHPAPIFGKPDYAARPRPVDSAMPPVPPTRPMSVAPAPIPPQAAPRSPVRDPIADIIRGSETTGSAPPGPRPGESRGEPQRVALAQRALLKLGYGPLKPDGVFGQGTRQAIERFERDRRLSATGELGPRTVRELSAQSGIRVE